MDTRDSRILRMPAGGPASGWRLNSLVYREPYTKPLPYCYIEDTAKRASAWELLHAYLTTSSHEQVFPMFTPPSASPASLPNLGTS